MVEGTSAQVPTGPLPAVYVLERALRRNRLTVFFRLVLVIPHLVVVTVLALVAIPVWLIALPATLVLGRLPQWIRGYLGGVGAWYQRMQAYYYLLTDAYPPFAFVDHRYPVQVTVPEATPIARWTVLVRILLIPVAYVASALLSGISVFVVFAWFAGVFAGRTPRAVFDAIATVQRYQWRIYAYMGLLVPTFPWGVFGDGQALPTYPQSYGYGYPPPGYGYPPPGWGPPVGPPPPAPRPRPTPFPTPPSAPPSGEPTSLPSYPPPPGQAYPPAAAPGGSTWAYAPMPAPPAWAAPTDGERREPGWYDGLLTSGGKAILIIVVVLGGLQVLLNGVQIAHGGGGLGLLQIGNVLRIDAARTDLDTAARSCDEGCSVAELQTDATALRARVAKAPSRGDRRQQVLADLDRLDGDLAASGPTLDSGLGEPLASDLARLDSDCVAYTKALLR